MAQTTRIYIVTAKGKTQRLVEATSAAQAIRHCVAQEYAAKVAGAKDVANLAATGTTVEKASEQTQTITTN